MSVPLDRLYHYLTNVVNHNLVIYRWDPHGSRKLEDLNLVESTKYDDLHSKPIMICHEQEPLNFFQWSLQEFKQHVLNSFLVNNREIFSTDEVAEHHARYHLRCATMLGTVANSYDKTLLLHSEKNSKDLIFYQKAGFVPVYYWSHAIIARDWFRYAEHDPTLTPTAKSLSHDFLIYNRAWTGTREYRLYFVDQLIKQQLLPACNMSFSAWDQDQYYLNHKFTNTQFQFETQNIHEHLLPNQHHSSASADYCAVDYQTTGIEVVLETIFDDSKLHLTEKALRPIACGQPFMLCATPGSLQYLRDYGFETFQELIDESYDTVTNSQDRIHHIVQEMKRIQALPAVEKSQLYQQLEEIAQRNKTKFFSLDFHNSIIAELQHNVDVGMEIMEQHRTGKSISECIELYQKIPQYSEWCLANRERTIEQYQQLQQLVHV